MTRSIHRLGARCESTQFHNHSATRFSAVSFRQSGLRRGPAMSPKRAAPSLLDLGARLRLRPAFPRENPNISERK